ncbi:hypothetical protein QJS04_geneDACA007930 [Acorus gramineus]|uniref:Uncharacterized protein n=1 Tax=Acorus gramineus TaxID=55184 RepID=A0AAV9B9N5_ACOGR|nr:hypothetical protein QJS04_geneDACA007930 [Acorus gramineus]
MDDETFKIILVVPGWVVVYLFWICVFLFSVLLFVVYNSVMKTERNIEDPKKVKEEDEEESVTCVTMNDEILLDIQKRRLLCSWWDEIDDDQRTWRYRSVFLVKDNVDQSQRKIKIYHKNQKLGRAFQEDLYYRLDVSLVRACSTVRLIFL